MDCLGEAIVKIVTWNVNGLRAALRNGAGGWLREENPDVICLQEIKVSPRQLTPEQRQVFEGYQGYWHPAARPGYSGTVMLCGESPLEVILGLGIPRYDVEGRVIRARFEDFWLFNVYFPSGQRGYDRVTYKLDVYRDLLELCDQMHAVGEKIIICGDFNTAHREIDLRYPKQNKKTSGFLPEERAWVDQYLAHGFVDVYRHLYPERVQYTWWTYRMNARQREIGWRLDYYLVSPGLVDRVRDIVIHAEVPGSDHCPVMLDIA